MAWQHQAMRKTIAKPISLTPEVYEMSVHRMAALGLTNFSAYIALLIRNDAIRGGSLVMMEKPKSPGLPAGDTKGSRTYRNRPKSEQKKV